MTYSESREEVTAHIKERSDIVEIIGEHVNLKRTGVRYLGLCPFHNEKTPSFSVHSGQQFYYCFGCGESGDVLSFMMKYHSLDFPSALKELANRYQIELPENKRSPKEQEKDRRRNLMFEVNKKAAELFRQYLTGSSNGGAARKYLEERGINSELQEIYQLGFAPSPDMEGWNFFGSRLNGEEKTLAIEVGILVEKEKGGTYDRFRGRIQFPIFDPRGRIAGFGGRTITEENPKYLNSPESPTYNKSRLLFGMYQQREAIRKQRRAVLVEGNFDLLSLVAHGFEGVVAPLGTALTRDQIRQLKPLVDEAVLLFDGDEAGVKAAERVVSFFLAEQVSGRVAILPDQHDPDTFVRERGLEELNNLVSNAETLPEFVVSRLVERYGLSLDGKGKIIEALVPLMSAASSSLQRTVMAAHFAKILGVEPEILLSQRRKGETSPPVVVEKERNVKMGVGQLKPLEGALKSLLGYMILNPGNFAALKEAGLAEILAGTIGEVIFVQLDILQKRNQTNLQPEDLLTALPEGEERALVASYLKNANKIGVVVGTEEDEPGELPEVVGWLKRFGLKRVSDRIIGEINEAQNNNDFEKISGLLKQKLEVDYKLRNL